MRVPRVLLIALPFLLGACGVIAGLDAYSESDNLTTDGGGNVFDGSVGTGDQDSSSGGPADAGSDSFVVVSNDGSAIDAGHDTGPPSPPSCMLQKNGSGCGQDAASCCSGVCDETHTCTGNSVKQETQGCNNGSIGYSPLQDKVHVASSECTVGLYCRLKSNDTSQGNCEPCLQGGQTQPAYTEPVIFVGERSVIFDDGCCSRQVDVGTGKCN